MTRDEIASVLDAAEAALRTGEEVDLSALGFWKAVAAVKRDPALVEPFADRIGEIDRQAFLRWALVTVRFPIGAVIAALGLIGGLVVIAAGYYIDDPAKGLLLLAGTVVVFTAIHSPAHAVVGMRYGMRFTHWFIGSIKRPQPGVKVDYATYLRTPARERAVMHAAGAVATKAVPFLMLGAAWGMAAPWWAWVALVGMGTVMIATDVAWSTRSSDWKKYRREMRYAGSESRPS